MFEELNERRKAVERNIAKGFGVEDADLDFEKAIEDEFEKGRAKKTFAIGDTFTRHGITYKCTGFSSNTGKPLWSKVKDGEGGKQNGSNSSVDKVKEFLKKLSPSYTDISKVTAFKMKNGDIAVLYDGNSVATLSDSAGKMLEDAGVKIEEDDKKKSKMVQDQLEDEEPEEKQEKTKKEGKKYEDLNAVGEFKNGFKFKNNTEYTLRYNKWEKKYEVFENKTNRGAGKVPMWELKSDSDNIGDKVLRLLQKKHSKSGSTISFGNKIHSL